MKNSYLIIFITIFLFQSYKAIAQIPQGVNYQAVLSDDQGQSLLNVAVDFRFNILLNGNTIYSEEHNTSTNSIGKVSLVIGQGTVLEGNFTAIDWSNESYSMEVYLNSGNGFQLFGTTSLWSVFYAFQAESAAVADSVRGIDLNSLGGSQSNSIVDADNDTKIQVEESVDEDIIRFDMGGTEFFRMDSGRLEVLNTSNIFIGRDAGINNVTNSSSPKFNTGIGHEALRANTYGKKNTALGFGALAYNTSGIGNIAIGYYALASNNTGNYNTSVGENALRDNKGEDNSAFGARALVFNQTGDGNSSVGVNSLSNNDSGDANCALGVNALYFNETGSDNIAIGVNTILNNVSGNSNTAIGDHASYENISGDYNTSTGANALYNNTTGSYNTAMGYEALKGNITGLWNTAIGYNALTVGTGHFNAIAIGYNAQPNASNTARIGNANVNSIGGYANWSNLSDGRFKTNVKEDVSGLDFILKLRPVTYNIDMDALARFSGTDSKMRDAESESKKAAEIQTGFIAQEVEAAAKTLGYNFSGVDIPQNDASHYGLRYAEFVVPLVKAMQEQQVIIQQQQTDIENLKTLVQQLINQK